MINIKNNSKLNILFEDKYLIAVLKPYGLLTVSTLNENYNTLYRKVSDYVKKQNKNNKIYTVHRLDKDTSGIVLFAKDQKTKNILQNNWDKVNRKYYGIVEGLLNKKGTIKNYLTETKTFKTYITNNKNFGKLAITHYEPILANKKYTLLNIIIETGRKNQIRVHMMSIGHPILGDKKYGGLRKERMCLHEYYLEFMHPKYNKTIILEDIIPDYFTKIMDNVK